MSAEELTGYLGLIAHILTLIPSNLRFVFTSIKSTPLYRKILKYRREIGLTCYFFSVVHSVLIFYKHQINMLAFDTYIRYFTGLGSITIFTVLAFTSNNWSIRKFGKNWKKLHNLTYIALFLLILHLLLANQGGWSIFTWCGYICLCLIAFLWLLRLLQK